MKALKSWLLGGALGMGIGFALGTVQPLAPRDSAPMPSSMAMEKKAAPDFTLPHYQRGQNVQLAAYRGKVVLLNFFETTCPHCQGEIPDLVRIQQALGGKGVEVIGVSLDPVEPKDLAGLAAKLKVSYPLALGNEDVATRYGGIDGVPTSFLIDRDGRIVKVFPGAVGFAALEQAIQGLL